MRLACVIAIVMVALFLGVALAPVPSATARPVALRVTAADVTPQPAPLFPTPTSLPDDYPAPTESVPYPAPFTVTQLRYRLLFPYASTVPSADQNAGR